MPASPMNLPRFTLNEMRSDLAVLLAIAPVACGARFAAWLDPPATRALTRREWAAAGLATLHTTALHYSAA